MYECIALLLWSYWLKWKTGYRQLCLIRTDVDPKFVSGLGKIRIMHIGIICIGRDFDIQVCPV